MNERYSRRLDKCMYGKITFWMDEWVDRPTKMFGLNFNMKSSSLRAQISATFDQLLFRHSASIKAGSGKLQGALCVKPLKARHIKELQTKQEKNPLD